MEVRNRFGELVKPRDLGTVMEAKTSIHGDSWDEKTVLDMDTDMHIRIPW